MRKQLRNARLSTIAGYKNSTGTQLGTAPTHIGRIHTPGHTHYKTTIRSTHKERDNGHQYSPNTQRASGAF